MNGKEREQAIHQAMVQVEKQFGKGSIIRLGSAPSTPVSVIPTGSIALDAALGVGGLPRGRVIEIFGPESSGKTTFALHAIAQSQKAGGTALFIDAEHAMDPAYAAKLGVVVDDLIVSQPDYGEQALEITAALVPKAELEGEMGDSFMGLHARLMSQALRKLTGTVARTNTCLIFINQIREKIGVVFGNPETTTGGRALKFFSSIRLDVRRTGPIKDGEVVVGSRTKVKVVKNKVAAPFREAEVELIHGEGVSLESELVDLGAANGLVEKSGSWYGYAGTRIGQGREQARQYLKDNPDARRKLECDLRAKLGIALEMPQPEPAKKTAVSSSNGPSERRAATA